MVFGLALPDCENPPPERGKGCGSHRIAFSARFLKKIFVCIFFDKSFLTSFALQALNIPAVGTFCFPTKISTSPGR